MKRIYLMRHSKAGQTDKNMLNDHERPLTQKGEEVMPGVAEYFDTHYKDNPPEIILSSTALRTKQTATLFKKSFKTKTDIEIHTFPELYITGNDEVLNVIRQVNNKYKAILIVSHNPGMHQFCMDFAGSGDKTKYRELKSNFPPASFATFDIDVKDWNEVDRNKGILLDFVSGKKLGAD